MNQLDYHHHLNQCHLRKHQHFINRHLPNHQYRHHPQEHGLHWDTI